MMEKRHLPRLPDTPRDGEAPHLIDTRKTVWTEPKLTFVEPTLTKEGEMKELTAGFIGTFVP